MADLTRRAFLKLPLVVAGLVAGLELPGPKPTIELSPHCWELARAAAAVGYASSGVETLEAAMEDYRRNLPAFTEHILDGFEAVARLKR